MCAENDTEWYNEFRQVIYTAGWGGKKMENNTSDKMTQAAPANASGSGNDLPVMSPQKKAELYAKLALIFGILAWIPYLIIAATRKTGGSVRAISPCC
jgi:hypothetical protein